MSGPTRPILKDLRAFFLFQFGLSILQLWCRPYVYEINLKQVLMSI